MLRISLLCVYILKLIALSSDLSQEASVPEYFKALVTRDDVMWSSLIALKSGRVYLHAWLRSFQTCTLILLKPSKYIQGLKCCLSVRTFSNNKHLICNCCRLWTSSGIVSSTASCLSLIKKNTSCVPCCCKYLRVWLSTISILHFRVFYCICEINFFTYIDLSALV